MLFKKMINSALIEKNPRKVGELISWLKSFDKNDEVIAHCRLNETEKVIEKFIVVSSKKDEKLYRFETLEGFE